MPALLSETWAPTPRARWCSPACSKNWATFLLMALYFAVGFIVYHQLENWSVLDAVYFSVVTMSTVGYGDLSPTTTASQVFTLFFIFFGILVVYARVGNLVSGITRPIFEFGRTIMYRLFPLEVILVDDLEVKVPRQVSLYYLQEMSVPVIVALLVQLFFAAVFTAVEPWDFWTSFYHCSALPGAESRTSPTRLLGQITHDGGKDGAALPLRCDGAALPLRCDGAALPLRGDGAALPLRCDGAALPLRCDGAALPLRL